MTIHSNSKASMITKYSTPSTFVLTAISASLMMMSSSVFAANAIMAMDVTKPTPNLTQLRLDFEGQPSLPEAYQLDNPSRLVLDFNDINNQLSSPLTTFNQGVIKEVSTLGDETTTRLIVGLDSPSSSANNYATQVEGNSLYINITPQSNTNAYSVVSTSGQQTVVLSDDLPAAQPIIVEPTSVTTNGTGTNNQQKQTVAKDTMIVKVNPLLNPQVSAAVSRQYSYDGLSAVNYVGNAQGGGNINITLTNEDIPIDLQRQGNKLVVRMTGATVPRNLIRRLNAGGLVASIDATNQNQSGVITINMAQDFEYQAYQTGNQLTISVSQPELLRPPTLEEKTYTGEPISFEIQDLPIRYVLDLLADATQTNIVASDSVSGNMTLRLYNVPWDQALDIILKSKDLGMRKNGNVILIAPAGELADQEAKELEAQQKVDNFLPLRTEYIRLSYAKAEDVQTLISQGHGSNRGANNLNIDSGSLLSDRGTVTVDSRTNTLIVQDTTDSIENIRELVAKIDIPVRQVMIEARIVSANDTFSKELGVRWGILSNGAANNRNLLVGGSNQTLWDLKHFDVQTTTVNGQQVSYPSYNISRPDNLNVDLGIANPAGRIAFGLLSMSDLMLDLELSAMQADNRGEVISTPKVLTADKQTARVSSGTQIPYQEASASGATTTSFREAALSLEATPNITPDGKIGLELVVTNGTPTTYNGTIAIAEDSISTNVIVEDGQTVVLGGVFRNTKSNGVEKVPFLGDLPYVGRLFKSDVRRNDKQELLIFVTPKLINDGVSRIN
ncbi:type IV pilus secretin PilQ [Psychrobacter sp. I-STPA10]|uniref:type IV pilus secretin PilQ n=1 Tax=Psychrobacter sp. I-STPA10 TaxID=2585769 RepID=UPI001E2B7AA1|nr:type IV pilus secretin PilQ [Psychrobacter sp. I-STPA10]